MQKILSVSIAAVAAAFAGISPRAIAAEGKRLVVGEVPSHTVGAYRPFVIPGEIAESDGMVERRKGREIVVWCPERTSRSNPAALAAAKRFVESPFLPVGSIRIGYAGDAKGEALLKSLGVSYKAYGPNEVWQLGGMQMVALGPGTQELFRGDRIATLKRILAEKPVLALPGADLALLPVAVGRARAKPGAEAKVPKLPLFLGTSADFAEFASRSAGAELAVAEGGPAWIQSTSPACFAHIQNRDRFVALFCVAPSDVPESARPSLTRVWCTMLANLNIESGCDEKDAAPAKSGARSNTGR